MKELPPILERRDGHTRRDLLRVGGLTALGIGLGDFFGIQSAIASDDVKPKSKSCILIWLDGGPSHLETFDPKPEATDTIRGEYGTTQTKLPGINFCEYLPKLAARADRFSIVRTMHHVAGRQFRNEHNSCHYLLHTGTTALPVGDTNASIVNPFLSASARSTIVGP